MADYSHYKSGAGAYALVNVRVEPLDSYDYFPTPPWAGRALCEWLQNNLDHDLTERSVWEPACGEGHLVVGMKDYFKTVRSSDLYNYGFGEVLDFFSTGTDQISDWIITNPPFRLGKEFTLHALSRVRKGVVMFVRTNFLESVGRYEDLFHPFPPKCILQFTERVPIRRGWVDENLATATSYCWIVWSVDQVTMTEYNWLPPCRKRLERETDYTHTSKPFVHKNEGATLF